MARPLRIEYPNAYYHVTNRGEVNTRIFPSEKYYQAFLEGLADACARLNVQVHGYCLLPGEYHLLIKTPEGNLSRFMRQVDGLYTQHYQRMRKAQGSIFRARYKAVLVQAEQYLLPLSRFIHTLPAQARKKPELYPWSSLGLFDGGQKPPAWFERGEIMAALGKGPRAFAKYADYVAEGPDAELQHFYGKKNLQSILGDEKFRTKARKQASPDAARGISRGAEARRRPSIKQVVAAVATHFKVSEDSIYHAARGPGSKNLPRWVAMYLCQELSGVTLQIIAQRFGLKRYGTVSTTIGKLKQEMLQVPKVDAQVRRLYKQLKPC